MINAQDPSQTLVLFYSWFNLDSTTILSLDYIKSRLEKSGVPIFALQEPMLWDGAIGGVFGATAPVGAALAKNVLQH